MTDAPSRPGPPWLTQLVDFAPLAAFVVTYFLSKDLFLATKVVMAASAAAVVVSLIVTRKIPWMPLLTAVLVGVFGGLTIYLEDSSFIKMKPSIINTLFGVGLLAALALGKLPLRAMMGHSFAMPERAWKVLTLRCAVFFLCLALLNEIVWRSVSEAIWVYFRFPGLIAITFLFFISQVPYMMRHSETDASEQAGDQ
ncbi:MAG: inner membrane-spanning protein YciB [Alphaproteobacteria bacterium]|nr:inner membrane-spanning protein YciB [Alphaproteobacteria bacterium]